MRLAFWKKADQPLATKGASLFFSMGGLRSFLTGTSSFNQLAAEGYCMNAVVFTCVNKIATAIASVDLQLYERKGKRLKQIEDHELLKLLENPNPAQSGDEFVRGWVSNLLTGGNTYIWGNGIDPTANKPKPPLELLLLNPGRVRVEPGPALFPKHYEYRATSDITKIFPVDPIRGKSAVLQVKTYNPLSAWEGMSPMIAAALGVDIYNGSQRWNKKLLDNDARPSGALTVKDGEGKPATLSDEQYYRLQEMLDSSFSGAANAGRPILLEGGLDWQQLSMDTKEMDFAEGKNQAARDIGQVYGVPPQLLGIKGDQTFANYEQAQLSFWSETVLPLTSLLLEALNRWLVPLYGDNLYLWYDENSIAALEPLRKQKADRINAAAYLTINEKRRAMGLDDVDGGDVVLVPSGLIPLDIAGSYELPEPGSPAATRDNAET